MKTIVVATGNKHKVQEFSQILSPLGWEVKALGEVCPGFAEPEETAPDFAGNARIKAEAALALLPAGSCVVADDSGLTVDILGGEPGVYSARFAAMAGRGEGDGANRSELVSRLEHEGIKGDSQTPAAFVCALHWIGPEGIIAVEGRVQGTVGIKARGWEGFGYDPLFRPTLGSGRISNHTFAEMPANLKNSLSHRGKALKLLARKLG